MIPFTATLACLQAVVTSNRPLGSREVARLLGLEHTRVNRLLGTLCLGLFASTAVNPGGVDGLFHGNPGQFGIQLFGAVVVSVYAFVVSWVIFKVINVTIGLRLSDEAEVAGLDSSERSETAYNN